jgi:RNA polymerase sigma factor (sigma-70 family)
MSLLRSIEMTEEQLVSGCISQDALAQKELYNRFSRKMFGVCLRYAESKEEAEDLLQEGFIKVYLNLSSFKAVGSLEGWIRKVMVNMAIENFRKQKIKLSGEDVPEDHADEENILSSLHAGEIVKIIQAMPKGYRAVFNLYAIEGYNHREIGELLGINENTSKSQYSRARAYLAEQIKQHYNPSSEKVKS